MLIHRRWLCLLAISIDLAAAANARAQAPQAADDPIQYPVTDASGKVTSFTVIPRKEHQERLDYLFAQIQFIDGGGKRFLVSDDGPYQPLLTAPAVEQALTEMKRMLREVGLPADVRARLERQIRDTEDPARQAAAKSTLVNQWADLKAGAIAWPKVQGSLRGTFRLSCTLDGKEQTVDGNFQLNLMGDGSVAAAIRSRRADGRISPYGEAEGSASGDNANVKWTAKFERAADGQLLMTRHTLEVTPTDGRTRCTGSMALGGDVVQPPATTWFPDPIDWRAVRGQIGMDGLTDCWGATGTLPRIYSRWTFRFVGDGSVEGTFQTMQGADFRLDALSGPTPISGTIDNYRMTTGSPIEGGKAEGRVPYRDGEFRWFLALRRPPGENKIQIHPGWPGAGSALELEPVGNFQCQGSWFGGFDVPSP